MRAAVFRTDTRTLAIETVADPTPGRGQVVIKVHRCGICGSDLHMAKGHTYSFDDGEIPGQEVSGEVVAKGPGAEGVELDDRVAPAPVRDMRQVRRLPHGRCDGLQRVSHVWFFRHRGWIFRICRDQPRLVRDTTCLPQLRRRRSRRTFGRCIARYALFGIKPGDRVLVMGAGAISLSAAYWAKRSGAEKVIMSATSRRREEMARAIGVDAFITLEEGRSLAEQSEEALGAAPDIVFECAGMPGSLDQAVSAVRRRGLIAAPGFCWTPDSYSALPAVVKEITLRYSNMYDTRKFEIAVAALDNGHVEPRAMISDVVALDRAPMAFEELRGRNNKCKVVIKP